MDLKSYYFQIIKELEANARDTQKQVEANNALVQKTQEEARLSSSASKSDKVEHSCDKDCKFAKLKSMFSPELLSKLLEYNLDPSNFSPKEAMKKLLNLGMPVEYVLLDLERNGTDIEGAKNLLSKNGLSNHLNRAISIGLENRSTSSAIAFAEGLIDQTKTNSKGLNLIS